MKKLICSLFFLLLFGAGHSQNLAVDCDGVSGQLSVGGGASFVSNSQLLTMSCWVKPQNNALARQSQEGIVGVRNDLDADFYLSKLPGGQLEGVFTNSNRQTFKVRTQAFSANANPWVHIALTYDGANLKLYTDGKLGQQTKASGVLLDSLSTFRIGALFGKSSMECFQGMIDEVRIWKSCQTENDLRQMMGKELDQPRAHAQLKGYFKLNEPSGALLAKDEVNGLDGLVNVGATFSKPGAPIFQGVVASLQKDLCEGDSTFLIGKWIKTAGNYRDTTKRAGKSDSLSIVELKLIPKLLIPGIVQLGSDSLICNISTSTYAWFREGVELRHTTRSIPLNHTGSYTVVAHNQHCPSDTSVKFHFVATSFNAIVNENSPFSYWVQDGRLHINNKLPATHQLSLIDMNGRTLVEEVRKEDFYSLDISGLSNGIYFLRMANQNKVFIKRLFLVK